MSFYVHARHVRDAQRPLLHRLSAFRSCVQLYRWLIRRRFRETYERFEKAFDLSNVSEDKLIAVMDALEAERRAFLQRLNVFERGRIRQKARGLRYPLQSEIIALYRDDFFITPPV